MPPQAHLVDIQEFIHYSQILLLERGDIVVIQCIQLQYYQELTKVIGIVNNILHLHPTLKNKTRKLELNFLCCSHLFLLSFIELP